MSMKVLMDPIPSGEPDRCSTHFKCVALMEHVLLKQGRTDVFFYLMVPDWATEMSSSILSHPNVRLIKYPYYKDRMREYLRYDRELDAIQAFNGEFWDFDLVFTSRTSMVPFTKAVMTSPRQLKAGSRLKRIVVMEEMIVMGFRRTVAKSDVPGQEMMTLSGYWAADLVFLATELELMEIRSAARKYFSPSNVKAVMEHLRLVVPLVFREVETKPDGVRFDGKREMVVSFTGRMESVSSNLAALYKLMFSNYAIAMEKKFRFVICTVSEVAKVPPPEFVDMRRPKREEFWEIARKEMDVMISLHNDAEFSLSIVEPVMLGVPLLVIDQDWSRSMFGPDYPFYVSGVTEAFAWVKLFYEDYETQYQKFREWHGAYFGKRLTDGTWGCMYEETYKFMQAMEADLVALKPEFEGRAENDMMKALAQSIADRDEFRLFDLLREMQKEGKLTMLADKTKEGDRDGRRIVFSTPWNELRYVIKQYLGFEDASTEVGHFRRVK